MTRRAILVCDLAGFSALCEAEGIDAGMRRVSRFRATAAVLIEGHRGTLVKAWGDNIAAVFSTVEAAKACAQALTAVFPCGSGVGYGELILDSPSGDVWGVEMNRACKLGEDVAKAGEVLLTDAARVAQ